MHSEVLLFQNYTQRGSSDSSDKQNNCSRFYSFWALDSTLYPLTYININKNFFFLLEVAIYLDEAILLVGYLKLDIASDAPIFTCHCTILTGIGIK